MSQAQAPIVAFQVFRDILARVVGPRALSRFMRAVARGRSTIRGYRQQGRVDYAKLAEQIKILQNKIQFRRTWERYFGFYSVASAMPSLVYKQRVKDSDFDPRLFIAKIHCEAGAVAAINLRTSEGPLQKILWLYRVGLNKIALKEAVVLLESSHKTVHRGKTSKRVDAMTAEQLEVAGRAWLTVGNVELAHDRFSRALEKADLSCDVNLLASLGLMEATFRLWKKLKSDDVNRDILYETVVAVHSRVIDLLASLRNPLLGMQVYGRLASFHTNLKAVHLGGFPGVLIPDFLMRAEKSRTEAKARAMKVFLSG
ncbi:MAG: hypothetical protein AAB552_03960 [Patescibacteria group bacterium]